MFEELTRKKFDVLPLHHAEAILKHDMPQAIADIEAVLNGLEVPIEELVRSGGGEALLTQRNRRLLAELGWRKQNVTVNKFVAFSGDDEAQKREPSQSLSHEIDHVKVFEAGVFALEIEWNNKDPFFDRDLESFKRLHAEGAISIGCIITRGQSLQANIRNLLRSFTTRESITKFDDLEPYDYAPTRRQRNLIEQRTARGASFADAWVEVFASDKFGEATTHWRKLKDRVERGVGNPCPLLLIGIPDGVVKV
ncbi:MAG: restriction endonuclease [Hyphomicrobium sp. 32-62-53]|nr:MAG: restriction endonuclease [Hyphomicrobium sp. 12-62-95]OYX99550.1 MAG: restriction endonuclease [Hyphomicrobium sp. 32-62-53]